MGKADKLHHQHRGTSITGGSLSLHSSTSSDKMLKFFKRGTGKDLDSSSSIADELVNNCNRQDSLFGSCGVQR
jgi:hypothetical protein